MEINDSSTFAGQIISPDIGSHVTGAQTADFGAHTISAGSRHDDIIEHDVTTGGSTLEVAGECFGGGDALVQRDAFAHSAPLDSIGISDKVVDNHACFAP